MKNITDSVVMSNKTPSLLLLAGLAVGLSACGIGNETDGKVDIVAGFYPLAYISEQVGGELVDVNTLAAPDTEAHDLELTPQQRTQVADADLAVYLKGFQPAFDEAVADHNKDRGFDAAAVEPLLDGYTPIEDEHAEEEHGEHEQGALAEDGSGKDPHVWLNPVRLANIVQGLGKRLNEIESTDGDAFNKAAAALRGRLQALDTEIDAALNNCRSRTIVVSHNAFGYFAERYNLQQIAIAGLSPEEEPSPERLAEVSRIAERNDVDTVFFESLVSPKVAKTIAAEIGAKTAELDPIETKPGSGDYFTQMRANTQALRTALQCS